jgi:hypothetical protein
VPHFEFSASGNDPHHAIAMCVASRRVRACQLEVFMNRDPSFALTQECEAKQPLLDQLRALTTNDPDFFTDILEGETNLLELIAALDASIVDDEILVDGAKAALDKLQTRKRAAENRIELKRRLLAHTLQQIGLKTLRTPTSTLTLADASLKAIAVAPEDIPARWWKPQPPKLDQDGLSDELSPSLACSIDDGVVGIEHAVGKPVTAQILPDVLDRVEFRRPRREEGSPGTQSGRE